MVIDAETRRKLDLAIEKTTADGRDLMEVLNGWRLLLTPGRIKEIEVQALERLWHKLDETSTSDILQVFTNRKEGTPADTHRAILDFIEAMINEAVKGTS